MAPNYRMLMLVSVAVLCFVDAQDPVVPGQAAPAGPVESDGPVTLQESATTTTTTAITRTTAEVTEGTDLVPVPECSCPMVQKIAMGLGIPMGILLLSHTILCFLWCRGGKSSAKNMRQLTSSYFSKKRLNHKDLGHSNSAVESDKKHLDLSEKSSDHPKPPMPLPAEVEPSTTEMSTTEIADTTFESDPKPTFKKKAMLPPTTQDIDSAAKRERTGRFNKDHDVPVSTASYVVMADTNPSPYYNLDTPLYTNVPTVDTAQQDQTPEAVNPVARDEQEEQEELYMNVGLNSEPIHEPTGDENMHYYNEESGNRGRGDSVYSDAVQPRVDMGSALALTGYIPMDGSNRNINRL